MGNVLSNSPTFTYTNLAVTPYSPALAPLNPDGVAVTTSLDSRILKSAEWNNTIVAAHTVSPGAGQDVVQWYAINVAGGTPSLAQQGRVGGGVNNYFYFPAIDINASGQIGMTYMRSGTDSATDYMSMYLTGRTPTDAAGTMQASVRVPAGTGQANYTDFSSGGRAGDLSGINVDPSDGSFWAANEFANTEANANWGTAVANFTVSSPVASTDMAVTAAGPSSVTVGTNATYTITVTNNGPNAAQGVVLTDILPAGSTFVSMAHTAGADAFTLSHSGSAAAATASATIAPGSSDTFSVTVSAPTGLANGAAFNDTASVSAGNPDANTANNSATVTGTVSNVNANADLAVKISGPATGTEGASATYTVTVSNSGPSAATGVTLTDTLGSLLSFQSATTSQGTFTRSGGVVTFSVGNVASGATVTAAVTAEAIEDGSTSDVASVGGTSPDPNSANNTAAATTSIAEPAISVSVAVFTRNVSVTNFQAATFTHADGVEPASAFHTVINWGDGTTSAGIITQSGTTYTVTGSHTYTRQAIHFITATVTEVGQAVDKVGDEKPGDDVERLRGHVRRGAAVDAADTRVLDHFFSLGARVLEQLLLAQRTPAP
jgi:uncharacterized repeat protein (TIGR01451 family)